MLHAYLYEFLTFIIYKLRSSWVTSRITTKGYKSWYSFSKNIFSSHFLVGYWNPTKQAVYEEKGCMWEYHCHRRCFLLHHTIASLRITLSFVLLNWNIWPIFHITGTSIHYHARALRPLNCLIQHFISLKKGASFITLICLIAALDNLTRESEKDKFSGRGRRIFCSLFGR